MIDYCVEQGKEREKMDENGGFLRFSAELVGAGQVESSKAKGRIWEIELTELVLGLILLLSATGVSEARYSGGTGEPNDPYRIATAADLNDISNHVEDYNKCFVMVADIDIGGISFDSAVIAPDTKSWADFQGTPFTGVFDGNSHVISNLRIEASTGDFVGLFGYIGTDGEIKDLGVEDMNIGGDSYVGGLCGENDEGTISNCFTKGSVTGGTGSELLGGLVGRNREGTVYRCYSAVSVSGYKAVGGLCGRNRYGTVSECHSVGSVRGDEYIGGLAGGNLGSIEQCYSNCATSGRRQVGGLLGNNFGTVNQCYSDGSVVGDYRIGGLCGLNWKYSWSQGTLTYCYSKSSVGGGDLVGGLVGEDYHGTMEQCYSTGSVSGSAEVGGLLGRGDFHTKVIHSFWDIETSGTTYSDGGFGLATANMQSMATYGFNDWAGDVWTIDDGNDYPHLWWENAIGEYIGESVVELEGSGTADNPWQIETVEDLQLIGLGSVFRDKSFILMSDLDVSGVYIYTIVKGAGCFDGNSHVISNLRLNMPEMSGVGLFSTVREGAEVKNLGLENVSVIGKEYVGAIVASNRGVISNCYSTGSVSGNSYVGGLCGQNYRGMLSNCYSMGSVTGTDYLVGGLCGHNNEGTISQCYSIVCVAGTSTVGGLCGADLSGTTRGCYSRGSVTGTGENVGGLCGYARYGTFSSCYSTASVSGGTHAGGSCGYIYLGTLHNCYSTGIVIGDEDVGGLCSLNLGGTISSSFWDVETSGVSASAGGVGLTTIEMMDLDTFLGAGWDFVDEVVNGTEDVWSIDDGNDYPRLWWERCLDQVEVEMKLTPQTLNTGSEGQWVKAHFKLPEGVLPEEVDVNRPAVFEPLGVESEYVEVSVNEDGIVEVVAAFDRSAICICSSEPILETVVVEGLSFSGQCFYGVDSIRVIDKQLELIEELAVHWLEDCVGPDSCGGSDLNADGVVNFRDYVLLEGFCVEIE